MTHTIAVEEFERLESAICSNENLSTAFKTTHVFPLARKRISEAFSGLDADERRLFTELIKRYAIHADYGPLSYELTEWMMENIRIHGSISLSTPYLSQPKEQKSAGIIAYELRGQLISLGQTKRNIDINDIVPIVAKPTPIFIVDDFSGSGRTVMAAIQRLKEIGQPDELIKVGLLYAMDEAHQYVLNAGIEVRAVITGHRCLSGFDFGDELSGVDASSTYDAWEARLSVDKNYRRGYAGSEALVSMKRTPNNTLPVFWFSGKDKSWPCPFPR